jgi:hypothetical protein
MVGCGPEGSLDGADLVDEENLASNDEALGRCNYTTLKRASNVRSGPPSWTIKGELRGGTTVFHNCDAKTRKDPSTGYVYVQILYPMFGWVVLRNVD